jgi:hypothetical protein
MSEEEMDRVEMLQAMKNIASLSRTFYLQLLEEGFDKKQALTLTAAWLASLSKGNAE